jgi:hypothetical protein
MQPDTVGEYRVMEMVGEGSFGKVGYGAFLHRLPPPGGSNGAAAAASAVQLDVSFVSPCAP